MLTPAENLTKHLYDITKNIEWQIVSDQDKQLGLLDTVDVVASTVVADNLYHASFTISVKDIMFGSEIGQLAQDVADAIASRLSYYIFMKEVPSESTNDSEPG